ncbi:DUF4138 domain-containing protein [Zobellia galactanivorans]|uniref:DUF4138 domain-containing protein n=1 Tax=Zobellia galactanivorans (strain DSM 12802 / CCUG 47099 / CIP 106680 / NCIMB 13871 / Dsij) TaxID=63186 RepID=UPI0026E2CC40|nr:DUF4138 domain-containing protein [Zobellia galactanivorans]MDO6811130.1 DUF4138 domain-containing protein [Zobellia galactanivorans]
MKTIVTLIFALMATSVSAQSALDTICANDRKNVALFFPDPIRQAITGSAHFVFTYNREKEQHFGLLQAKPGPDSNLLTVTTDGLVYSYILRFSDSLPKLNYFIDQRESLGNESRPKEPLDQKKQDHDSIRNPISEFEANCKQLLEAPAQTIAVNRKKGIKLHLLRLSYSPSHVYMVIQISNRSSIDFELDFLNVSITNGNKKRKASFQRLRQEVVFEYGKPKNILNGHSKRFVYVLPKFVLGDNEKLVLVLQEKKGSRNLTLKTRQ